MSADGGWLIREKIRPDHPFVAALGESIRREDFGLERHSRVGIAVSGGPDSMALLAGMQAIDWGAVSVRPVVLHFRHSDSPEDLDAHFLVEETCERLSLELASVAINHYADERPDDSRQMSARRNRYAFFRSECSRMELTHLFIGHTLDDHVETVLMRMTSGHWLGGLSGIPAQRKLDWRDETRGHTKIVRPMLDMPRELVRSYAEVSRLGYIDDPSNDDASDRRFAFRKNVLPTLLSINPKARENIAAIASQALAAENSLRVSTEPLVPAPKVHKRSGEWNEATHWAIRFRREMLKSELSRDQAAIAVRIALEHLGAEGRRVTRERCLQVVAAAGGEEQTKTTSLLKGIHFRVTKREVVIICDCRAQSTPEVNKLGPP